MFDLKGQVCVLVLPEPWKGPPVPSHSRRRAAPVFLSLCLLLASLFPGSLAGADEPPKPPLTTGAHIHAPAYETNHPDPWYV
jgi:hypothetical protein